MTKNKKLILLGLLFLGISGTAGAAYVINQRDDSTPPVTTERNYVEDEDQPLTNGTPGTEDKVITPSESAYDTDETMQLEKPNITRAEQSGDFIRVSALLSQPSTGECKASFTKDGSASLDKRAKIIVGPSYYTCNGFRIPRSEFAPSGQWKVTVTHELNGKQAVSNEVKFEIN